MSAEEDDLLQSGVIALLDEAGAFGGKAGEVDELWFGFSDFVEEGLEEGIADGNRIRRRDGRHQRQ